MKRLWNIADLIDLHYFCLLDEELQRQQGESALAKRDRVIYLAKIAPQQQPDEPLAPQVLVRQWLSVRRVHFRQEKGRENTVLPGSLWQELSVVGRLLILLLGVLVGAGAAGSLLLYTGTDPLNVSLYFGLFVVVQVFLVLVQAGFLLYRFLWRVPMKTSSWYFLLGRGMIRMMDWVRRIWQRHVSGEHRLDLAAVMGNIQKRRELAVLLLWPAFILVQLGGIGFNLGVLGATLGKVFFSDMAFAWQSSLQVSPQVVADLVRWIALPWSWIGTQAYPSLAQVQGSQIILKEGMLHLHTADLVSWWPFLCCCVVTYGLLPRLLLLLLGWWQQRRSLKRLRFVSVQFRDLLRRMTVPHLETEGTVRTRIDAGSGPEGKKAAVKKAPCVPVEEPVQAGIATSPALLLIPAELYDDCPLPELLAAVARRYPDLAPKVLQFGEDAPPTGFADVLDSCEVLVLFEAWQPPLRETATFLKSLRGEVGETKPITILLIGKPSAATMCTPVLPVHLGIWKKYLQTLGDASLSATPLIAS